MWDCSSNFVTQHPHGENRASGDAGTAGGGAATESERNVLVQRIALHLKNAHMLVALAPRLDTPSAAATAAAVAAAAARVKAKEAKARRDGTKGTKGSSKQAAEVSIDDYLDEENLREQTPDAEVLPRGWNVADGAPVYVRNHARGGINGGNDSPHAGGDGKSGSRRRRGGNRRKEGERERGPPASSSAEAGTAGEERGKVREERNQGHMQWREITKQPFDLILLVDDGSRILLGMPEYGPEEQEAARREGRKSGGLYIEPTMAEYYLILSIYFGKRHGVAGTQSGKLGRVGRSSGCSTVRAPSTHFSLILSLVGLLCRQSFFSLGSAC